MLRLRTIAILLLAAVALVSCTPTGGTQPLKVGMELAYPPFETTDDKNQPAGLSVDLANEIGKSLGRAVKIENMAFSGLIPALETGKVDLVISSMTIRDDRKEKIDFSDPYAMANLALVINNDSPVQNYDDLKAAGRKLAVKETTTGHTYALEHLPSANIVSFADAAAAVAEVVAGRADAFTYDQLSIYQFQKQYPDKLRMNLKPYQSGAEYWGIGLKKGSPLTADVNKALAEFRKNGGFDRLADKHLAAEKAVFRELGVPFFFDVPTP